MSLKGEEVWWGSTRSIYGFEKLRMEGQDMPGPFSFLFITSLMLTVLLAHRFTESALLII